MQEQAGRYEQEFWKDILIGDYFLGVVGTGGALGVGAGSGAGASGWSWAFAFAH
jgi:hypothetical protein